MGPDRNNSPFHAHVRAALDGLGGLALDDLDPGALLVVLTVVGDALRLGLGVPGPVLRAVEAVPEGALRAAFGALAKEVATWSLPVEPGPDQESPMHAWAVRRRDEAESVIVAARRILVPKGILPADLEEVRTAAAALAGLDFTCGGRYDRADVERVLEERVVLTTPGSWLEALPETEPVVEGAGGSPEAAGESMPLTAPSDESVDEYVTHGRLVAWIEGAARRSPAFAEELEAMIEADRAADPTVTSLQARRWLRARRGGAARPSRGDGPRS